MRKNENGRITFFMVIVGCGFLAICYRLFVLSYLRHAVYAQTAQAQTERITNILTRGNIYFTDKDDAPSLAAANKKFAVVSVVASKVDPTRSQEAIDGIVRATGIKPETVTAAVRSGSDYARTLSTRLSPDQVQAVKALGIKGIGVSYITDRFYPNGELGADVLGFLGYSGDSRAGQYGVESFYNAELSASGRPKDIILTIDRNIQRVAEDALEAVIKKWSAAGGSVIVEDPATGKILAMADRPVFDPNDYASARPETFLNTSVQQIFEPGSTFKPITMAAGLDLGKVTPQTSYEDTGSVTIGGFTIGNFSGKVFGRQTMAQVLEKSINTGAMFVENLVGKDKFLDYVLNFGFSQRTGVDLPGEVSGDISNLYSGRAINYLTASFGQGIAVTPLQLVNAYAAVANGGKLMRPYVVGKIVTEGGGETVTKPEVVGIPISERTAGKLAAMLVSVVDNGFDKARIKGYDIAGKTGTAQISDGKGGYLPDQYIHNFAGFAPAYNPRFVILIKMDRPQGITFAADSLSPVFRDIASFLIQYYGIPPSR